MYVWSPTGKQRALWVLHDSNSTTGVETVVFSAQNTGTYQIEVHGYTDAEYRLSFIRDG